MVPKVLTFSNFSAWPTPALDSDVFAGSVLVTMRHLVVAEIEQGDEKDSQESKVRNQESGVDRVNR